jgi:hypothetical protein
MIKSINKDDQGCIGTRKGYNNKWYGQCWKVLEHEQISYVSTNSFIDFKSCSQQKSWKISS